MILSKLCNHNPYSIPSPYIGKRAFSTSLGYWIPCPSHSSLIPNDSSYDYRHSTVLLFIKLLGVCTFPSVYVYVACRLYRLSTRGSASYLFSTQGKQLKNQPCDSSHAVCVADSACLAGCRIHVGCCGSGGGFARFAERLQVLSMNARKFFVFLCV